MNRLLLYFVLATQFEVDYELPIQNHMNVRIAVIGMGGLGHLGIQYSKVSGFETIAVTHSKDKEELAIRLGANQVVTNGEELR